MNSLNGFLFIGLPYLTMALFLAGTIFRYRQTGFRVSSLSSQFLEGQRLFWGSVPFHWGILALFVGHLWAFFLPEQMLLWNSHPVRLLALEVTGAAFGLSVLFGLVFLLVRRLGNPRVRMVTNRMDLTIEILLIAQVILGCWTAIGYRWGSSWFAADLTPYLRSLFLLRPDISAVVELPLIVKLHMIGAFLITGLFPFTRLVHLLVAPFHYIWRPYQRVIWNWDRKTIRDPAGAWSRTRPRNN
ncbi:MAG: respiratory nitrate reductase subunit gamma [Gemmatimonadota bacterium]|jgi:nitrate reductase gamma subunit|nr:respiratory nitrate reductase subunit gamma [Gemmatimonadota bacterium]MDP6803162.1 respiratory nitrate reductase subunit gamma [Gemmatimonadota bacterium]MDP7030669.1 respiratory nitrate reductase subunit gamma [Gemmatimonadota bacterium]